MHYEIRGRVVQETDRSPLAGLRVEAWDADLIADDFLGAAITGPNGEFVIEFDESRYREWIGDHDPDVYFRVYRCGDRVASTRGSVLWNVKDPTIEVEILVEVGELAAGWNDRDIYLKIERIEDYSTVRPQDKVVPPVQYGRDCLRGDGHENALIPEAEIQARKLTAVVYREYLDSAYLVPKPNKLIQADLNEPVFSRRVFGTVIYARPGQRLRIHVWNCSEEPHSLHMHGLRYGIDSDGSWPLGIELAHHGGRSDAICTDGTWTYTFEITEDMVGAWPFHDHTHHHLRPRLPLVVPAAQGRQHPRRRRPRRARQAHPARALLRRVLRPRPADDHNAPGTINYGTTFQVDTPTPPDISEVVVLRPGAVTHGFNQSQRGLELVISGTGAGTIDVESPPNPNLAPPGWYLLFVLNASRVPSVGRWVRVTP